LPPSPPPDDNPAAIKTDPPGDRADPSPPNKATEPPAPSDPIPADKVRLPPLAEFPAVAIKSPPEPVTDSVDDPDEILVDAPTGEEE
jgi:hypothetical protein